MMTSCSPGWIKFVEQFYPDFIPNLSTCKSPQQMLGAVVKTFLRRARRASTRLASSAWRSCRARRRSSRPAGPRWAATAGGHRRGADHARAGRAHPDARPRPDGPAARRRRHAVRRAHVGRQAVRGDRRRDGGRDPHGPLPADRRDVRPAQGAGAPRPRRHQGVPHDGGRPRDRRRGGLGPRQRAQAPGAGPGRADRPAASSR